MVLDGPNVDSKSPNAPQWKILPVKILSVKTSGHQNAAYFGSKMRSKSEPDGFKIDLDKVPKVVLNPKAFGNGFLTKLASIRIPFQ